MANSNEPKENKYKEITALKFNIASNEEILKSVTPQLSVDDEVNKVMENFSHLDPMRKEEMETMQRYIIEKRRREFEERLERRRFVFEKVHNLDELHKKKPVISDYTSMSGKTYTKYLVDLFNINEEKAVEILKKHKGNVYNAIIFYNHLLY